MDATPSLTSAAASYQPPELVVLGSIHELTLGSTGSVADNNGRAHGKIKTK